MPQYIRHSVQTVRAFVRGMNVELEDLRKESSDEEVPVIIDLAINGWAQAVQCEPRHVTRVLNGVVSCQ